VAPALVGGSVFKIMIRYHGICLGSVDKTVGVGVKRHQHLSYHSVDCHIVDIIAYNFYVWVVRRKLSTTSDLQDLLS
jgi:hypothetical protein